jgi:Domain of unknown function (DUF4347)
MQSLTLTNPAQSVLFTNTIQSMTYTMTQSIALQNRQSVVAPIAADSLVVFDSRVADLSLLYKALMPGTIGYTIDESDDAIARITALLSQTGAKQLAIVAHGEPGVIQLGRESIDLSVLQARSGLLQEWCVDSIALYSCEVGADKSFVKALADVTGAQVAASARQVGAEALGGSWELDAAAQDVSQHIFSIELLVNYGGVFAPPVVDLNGGTAGVNSTAIYTEVAPVPTTGGTAIVSSSGLAITGSSTNITSATIEITNLSDAGFEILDVTLGTTVATGSGLTKSYDSSTALLTISGNAAQSVYQTVLRTLVYRHTSNAPTDDNRVIEIQLRNEDLIISKITTVLALPYSSIVANSRRT